MGKNSWRYAAVALCIGVAAAGYRYGLAPVMAADAPAVRIAVEAKKFAFGPKEIRVKKGTRITIVLTSPDFVHGFSVPDFKVRADGIPGKTIEVTFVADKAGKFIFLCDNFCGEDHDRMTGWLVVTET
jgi:cytochrome c oxidase subunit II